MSNILQTDILKGKNALVTGSTSGIGLGMARALASAGANVMINGLGEADEIEATRAAIEADFGGRALFHGANMLNGEEIRDMVATAEAELGSVDILINNAGIQYVSAIDEFPEDKWQAIIAINLVSNFHTIKAALPGMKARNWGRIINLASAHGLVASPYKSAYVAAKHGVLGLTKTVALEIAETPITCNAICPGYVRTPLVEGQIKDQAKVHKMSEEQVIRDVILAAQPNKRFVEIEELGQLAVFLCGPAANSINGASLPVEGGWTAR
ncbi:3-hydroxybutyrate dehydrogenase [Luteithermobacter gelatinilyticus]|uniref:3-hydroxybutyrate dehydrogenase n=1 Tax=Luteithermobacter gelatinilyticus TaxID=2582913 RepID=UPI001106606A|nr:3-hydroxybutyrate dehydrogenase [Luteithermobacter gelatinilyticus]|tara:strand:+ start:6912 stop:7718 length:807 start_codon:yes stop_codon:yes gene_type:complete